MRARAHEGPLERERRDPRSVAAAASSDMDVYNSLPDLFTYHSFKHVSYERQWAPQLDSKGRPLNNTNKTRASCSGTKLDKHSCPICQEKQRRPLSNYIRSKSRQDRKQDVYIEEETENSEASGENLQSTRNAVCFTEQQTN